MSVCGDGCLRSYRPDAPGAGALAALPRKARRKPALQPRQTSECPGGPLQSVPVDVVTAPTTLDALHAVGTSLQISPGGRFVVYVGVIGSTSELYAVRVDGGSPTRLNGPLPAEGDVAVFEIGRFGNVFYIAAQTTSGQTELYTIRSASHRFRSGPIRMVQHVSGQ